MGNVSEEQQAEALGPPELVEHKTAAVLNTVGSGGVIAGGGGDGTLHPLLQYAGEGLIRYRPMYTEAEQIQYVNGSQRGRS
jgi:hypothetical protein